MSTDPCCQRLHLVRRILAVVAALLVTGGVVMAGEKSAIETLTKVPLFAFGGIGYAGTTSEGETAFKSVLASESAGVDFLHILKKGTPQAQCYALVGLRLKDRPQFDEQVKQFALSKQTVKTCAGCILGTQPMSSVVTNIQHGIYDDQAKAKLRSTR